MIGLHLVQAAIVAVLKADATLVGLVGEEIREIQWQGTEFTYPAVRVGMGRVKPIGESCVGAHSRAQFKVSVFSEKASSLECDQITAQAVEVLFLNVLSTVDFNSGLIRIPFGINPAIRLDEHVWRTESDFETYIYES